MMVDQKVVRMDRTLESLKAHWSVDLMVAMTVAMLDTGSDVSMVAKLVRL